MDYTYRSLCLCIVILVALFTRVSSYSITVDAHAEECFFEHVEADTKMGEFSIPPGIHLMF